MQQPPFKHYRANFRPSATLERPCTIVTLLTVVAETDDRLRLRRVDAATADATARWGSTEPFMQRSPG
jgi:hypothetical protein